MKETIFYIRINIKTTDGFDSIGQFYAGDKKSFAYTLFENLKGSTDVSEQSLLSMELVETRQSIPFNLKIKNCSLDELADNCKRITIETFKQKNLEWS